MLAFFIALMLLGILILYMTRETEVVEVEVEVPVPVPVPVRPPVHLASPPPYKQYKPPRYQQMGLLLGDNEVLPLYGRETPTRRDSYNYYTTTPGEQKYSLPINFKDRDCTEDIGCQEFYGGEEVTVLGRDGEYTTKIYRNRLTNIA